MLERSSVDHRVMLGMQTSRQRFLEVLQDRDTLEVRGIHRVDAPSPIAVNGSSIYRGASPRLTDSTNLLLCGSNRAMVADARPHETIQPPSRQGVVKACPLPPTLGKEQRVENGNRHEMEFRMPMCFSQLEITFRLAGHALTNRTVARESAQHAPLGPSSTASMSAAPDRARR
jgi:hypothetical protein